MDVRLDYGRSGLLVRVPDTLAVSLLEPHKGVPLDDPSAAIEHALADPVVSAPLSDLARGRRNAAVVISDKTRPVPYGILLPPILRILEAAGLRPDHIEILVATGLHRPNTRDELCEMTSPAIVDRYRIRNHVARNADEHVHLGRTLRGTEVWIDGGFVAADLKIVTGLIEPHLMAGYSGGRKAICPGLCAAETIMAWHSPQMLEPPEVRAGNLRGSSLKRSRETSGHSLLFGNSLRPRPRQLRLRGGAYWRGSPSARGW